MDYGFAPGIKGEFGVLRNLFGRRPSTTLAPAKNMGTVRGFVSYLNNSVGHPIGDVLIGAHAHSDGTMLIPMFSGQKGKTSYEILEKTLTDTNKSVKILDTTIGYGAGPQHNVHIRGCNIGKAYSFLVKLREALGDHVQVTAPKHFYEIYDITNVGSLEYMKYEFIVRSQTNLDRTALIAAFQAAQFDDINGDRISADLWGQWIAEDEIVSQGFSHPKNLQLGETVGGIVTCPSSIDLKVESGAQQQFDWKVSVDDPTLIDTNVKRLAELRKGMSQDARFSPSHPFPYYERWGYWDFDAFFSGFNWGWDKMSAGELEFVVRGTRTEYTLKVPITDPGSGHLIFNYYHNQQTAPIVHMPETDARFFETV